MTATPDEFSPWCAKCIAGEGWHSEHPAPKAVRKEKPPGRIVQSGPYAGHVVYMLEDNKEDTTGGPP